MDVVQDLTEWKRRLQQFVDAFDVAPEVVTLHEAWQRAREFSKSASGSWIGYHANVYYKDFQSPPPGEHFDLEFGTGGSYFSASNPDWVERSPQQVSALILGDAGEEALSKAQERAEAGLELLHEVTANVLSVLSLYLENHEDPFVKRISEEIEASKVLDAAEIAKERSPKGQVMTRDQKAVQQGTWVPPHVKIEARISAVHQASAHSKELAKRLDKLSAHLARAAKLGAREAKMGTNVFIGHGRSPVWRDLKDFIKDRLRLPYDEFNRVPVAGITNIARLSEMLDAAACAFVIMTAEDELADGSMQARMNVIHEVGLSQGRLGFTKAIVLLEEECEEFANIQGLGQIRFPKGNISAKFEEIRLVLEREDLLS